MVSKPFVCENNEAARGIKVEELPGNFGHPWATQNGGQPLFVLYPTYFAGLQFSWMNEFKLGQIENIDMSIIHEKKDQI